MLVLSVGFGAGDAVENGNKLDPVHLGVHKAAPLYKMYVKLDG